MSRLTEDQIAFALKQAETGTLFVELLRRVGISKKKFYTRRKLYDGLRTSEPCRLQQLEEQNRKLKLLVADLSLNKHTF